MDTKEKRFGGMRNLLSQISQKVKRSSTHAKVQESEYEELPEAREPNERSEGAREGAREGTKASEGVREGAKPREGNKGKRSEAREDGFLAGDWEGGGTGRSSMLFTRYEKQGSEDGHHHTSRPGSTSRRDSGSMYSSVFGSVSKSPTAKAFSNGGVTTEEDFSPTRPKQPLFQGRDFNEGRGSIRTLTEDEERPTQSPPNIQEAGFFQSQSQGDGNGKREEIKEGSPKEKKEPIPPRHIQHIDVEGAIYTLPDKTIHRQAEKVAPKPIVNETVIYVQSGPQSPNPSANDSALSITRGQNAANVSIVNVQSVQKVHSEVQKVPSEDQKVPSEDQKVSSGDQKVPSEVQKVPSEVQKVPSEVQQVPSGVQKVPSGDQKVPSEVQKVPSVHDQGVQTVQMEEKGVQVMDRSEKAQEQGTKNKYDSQSKQSRYKTQASENTQSNHGTQIDYEAQNRQTRYTNPIYESRERKISNSSSTSGYEAPINQSDHNAQSRYSQSSVSRERKLSNSSTPSEYETPIKNDYNAQSRYTRQSSESKQSGYVGQNTQNPQSKYNAQANPPGRHTSHSQSSESKQIGYVAQDTQSKYSGQTNPSSRHISHSQQLYQQPRGTSHAGPFSSLPDLDQGQMNPLFQDDQQTNPLYQEEDDDEEVMSVFSGRSGNSGKSGKSQQAPPLPQRNRASWKLPNSGSRRTEIDGIKPRIEPGSEPGFADDADEITDPEVVGFVEEIVREVSEEREQNRVISDLDSVLENESDDVVEEPKPDPAAIHKNWSYVSDQDLRKRRDPDLVYQNWEVVKAEKVKKQPIYENFKPRLTAEKSWPGADNHILEELETMHIQKLCQEKSGSVVLTEEYNPKNFLRDTPTHDASGMEIPSWKRHIMARQLAEKAAVEGEERKKKEEEEARFKNMPPWKRALIEKKEADFRSSQQQGEKADPEKGAKSGPSWKLPKSSKF